MRNVVVENARIGFRNFSGKEGRFNPAGKRNFCLFLDDQDLVSKFVEDGWNVRFLKPREMDDKEQAYLQVSVSFDNYPPKIVLVTSNGKTVLTDSEVNMLDWAEIENVDLVIRPYEYNVNGKQGIKAYLKSMYVTIEEDELEKKYYDTPDSASNSLKDTEDDIDW